MLTCDPLNANELLFPAQRAELQKLCVWFCVTLQLPFVFKLESDNDGETQDW